jgi:hypothetical protein
MRHREAQVTRGDRTRTRAPGFDPGTHRSARGGTGTVELAFDPEAEAARGHFLEGARLAGGVEVEGRPRLGRKPPTVE